MNLKQLLIVALGLVQTLALPAAEPFETWTPRTSPTNVTLTAVAYGNGTRVVVGQTGTILQSGSFGSVPDPITLSQVAKASGQFSFKFNGTVGENYQVQATTNFVNWTTLTNFTCTVSPMNCNLGGQTNPRRFYRVLKM